MDAVDKSEDLEDHLPSAMFVAGANVLTELLGTCPYYAPVVARAVYEAMDLSRQQTIGLRGNEDIPIGWHWIRLSSCDAELLTPPPGGDR